MRNKRYTVALAKGCGLINETMALLAIYKEGMTRQELERIVLEQNILGTSTEKRAKDIVSRVFAIRYMTPERLPLWLKSIRQKGLPLKQFTQLLFVYTARNHGELYDYVVERYQRYNKDNRPRLPQQDARDFIDEKCHENDLQWSENMRKRVSSYLKASLKDFNFIDASDNILNNDITQFTFIYFLHEMHFAEMSDMAIWDAEDWKLFGLNKYDVLQMIMNNSLRGGYIAQSSGELVDIAWQYKSMEEMIDATL